MFTTNYNRKHCQIRTKPEVCASGTWRFWVIREGSVEKEAFESGPTPRGESMLQSRVFQEEQKLQSGKDEAPQSLNRVCVGRKQ